MIWYILLILGALFLVWLLAVPVMVSIDTSGHSYLMSLPGIFSARIVPTDGLFQIRGWILFIPYRFNPFMKKKRKKDPEKEAKKKKKKFRIPSGGIPLARDAMRSVRIRKLELELDTDDFLLNAWLVPLFSAVNDNTLTSMRVNFQGYNSLLLDMRIRLGALLWALIRNRYLSIF
jgi:hypothetical protein